MTEVSGIKALFRLLTNACPRCGSKGVIRTMFHIHTHCSQCDLLIDRGNGFLLGSIAVSYLIVAVWIAFMIALGAFGIIPSLYTWVFSITFVVLFPILFHAYTKLIWVGIYYAFLPKELFVSMEDLEPPDYS